MNACEFSISVVVPTRNRSTLLAGLVRAFEAQVGVGSFEVVFVDDASSDETPAELARLRQTSSVPLVIERMSERRGPAAARNVGWRAARAPLIAFTDDDCRPTPEWLGRLLARFDGAVIVQGRTLPDPEQQGRAGPFSRTIETVQEWGFYETCNVAYRREALVRVGGFDEGFREPFGEDTDVAWRVKESGGASVFEPEAVVYHAVWPQSFTAHLRDLPRRAGIVRALHRSPGLRQRLPRRWFWRPSHKPALAAAAGIIFAVTRRSPLAVVTGLALGVPYAHYRLRVEPLAPPSRQPVVLPQALVADLAEVAVLAAASVRYRTLLL